MSSLLLQDHFLVFEYCVSLMGELGLSGMIFYLHIFICNMEYSEMIGYVCNYNSRIAIRRVTWGKAPPFGDDLSLTYLFASTSEKSYIYLTNYMLCV